MVKTKVTVAKAKTSVIQKKKPKRSSAAAIPQSVSSLQFTGINDDCLAATLMWLDIAALLKMCKLADRFKTIIMNRIISRKTVNFSELKKRSSVHKLFEQLGHSMRRIEISTEDIQFVTPGYTQFSELLRLLAAHCPPGQLKSVKIRMCDSNIWRAIPTGILDAVKPCFENVNSLTLEFGIQYGLDRYITQFLTAIPKHNLQSLVMHNITGIGNWLSAQSMPNLRELHFCYACIHHFHGQDDRADLQRLKHYIASKPALTSFHYIGRNHEAVFNAVAKHIPNIERIGMVRNTSVFDSSNNNGADDFARDQSARAKWKYLQAFTQLKDFSLSSQAQNFSNCGEIFRILANQNTVQNLELTGGYASGLHQNPIQMADLKRLTSLKSLHLVDMNKSNVKGFLNDMYENLSGLSTVKFSGGSLTQGHITDLIQRVPNLRSISINARVTSFSKQFYKKMVKIRTATIEQDDPLQEIEPLEIHYNNAVVSECLSDLGTKYYKPSVVTLKSI